MTIFSQDGLWDNLSEDDVAITVYKKIKENPGESRDARKLIVRISGAAVDSKLFSPSPMHKSSIAHFYSSEGCGKLDSNLRFLLLPFSSRNAHGMIAF